jgi:hypothetical protein
MAELCHTAPTVIPVTLVDKMELTRTIATTADYACVPSLGTDGDVLYESERAATGPQFFGPWCPTGSIQIMVRILKTAVFVHR